jgi:hypothetical protein
MLTFKKSNNLEIIGYSDSDFSNYIDSKKFISYYIFMLIRESILWKSDKQSITLYSTMQVKFMT